MMSPAAPRLDLDRRGALVGLVALAGGCCSGIALAQALETAREPVLLTITGRIARVNAPVEARFDLPMLAALPQQTFSPRTPWYAKRANSPACDCAICSPPWAPQAATCGRSR
ncbi:MAG: hypothetical protein ABIO45_12695 [Burkholderiaceae bacterium]